MENKNSKWMPIALWAGQILVSIMLLWGAYAKLAMPLEALSEMMPWASENPILVKFTGVIDLLGGLGLILPGLLKFKPTLTIYAAYGTALLMIFAGIFHLSRGENTQIGMNIFILLVALFIAKGRQKTHQLTPNK